MHLVTRTQRAGHAGAWLICLPASFFACTIAFAHCVCALHMCSKQTLKAHTNAHEGYFALCFTRLGDEFVLYVTLQKLSI
jgi:hypothetical protein